MLSLCVSVLATTCVGAPLTCSPSPPASISGATFCSCRQTRVDDVVQNFKDIKVTDRSAQRTGRVVVGRGGVFLAQRRNALQAPSLASWLSAHVHSLKLCTATQAGGRVPEGRNNLYGKTKTRLNSVSFTKVVFLSCTSTRSETVYILGCIPIARLCVCLCVRARLATCYPGMWVQYRL